MEKGETASNRGVGVIVRGAGGGGGGNEGRRRVVCGARELNTKARAAIE